MRINVCMLLVLLSYIARAGIYHEAIDYIFPLPDSELLPVKTTVILKLDESYNNRISDLSGLIGVKDAGVVRGGHIFFAGDNRTVIFKPNSDFQRGRTLTVTVQLSQFGFDDFQYNFTTAKSSSNDLDWLDKTKPAAGTPIRDVQTMSPVRLMNGVAVPSDFPEIRVTILGETAPGRIFIPAGKWIIICDNDGTPYFYRKYEDGHEKMRFEPHPTGVLSFHSYEVYDVILNQNFIEIDTVYPGHGYLPDDHELQILENGHMLLVGRDDVRIDMSKIVSGGNSNALVEAHHVQELDQDHQVIFEWRNWDHLDIRDTQVSLRGNFVDFVHTNSIAVDYDGHYIISPREYNMIMKVDHITGETIWILGGKNSDFSFINEDIEFSRIHDVRPVPGKPDQYTLFDNGRDRSDGTHFSRAVEYKLDLDAMTAEKVWEYRHHPDLYSTYCGSCQPLENGNRLIGWAGNDLFSEVDSSGELVYEMVVPGFSCSRCRRYEWEGIMLRPYLILENMGSVIRLIFNKFGDPDVNYYTIYTGVSALALSPLDMTAQTYYDIDANLLNNGSQYFFRVTAVNNNGEESDFSNMESTYISNISPGVNAVRNGDFESVDEWNLHTSGGAQATGGVNAEGQYQISISNTGSDFTDVQLEQDNVIIMQGENYVFSFDAYATKNKVIEVKVESANSLPTDYSRIGNTAVSTRLRHYEFDFFMQDQTDTEARVVFNIGRFDGNVFIDNVSLLYGAEEHVFTPGGDRQPQAFDLYPAYPNPFNPQTTVTFRVPVQSTVRISIYDVCGRKVHTLVAENKLPGIYQVNWNGMNDSGQQVTSGVYFIRMCAKDFECIQKLTLLK
jgi:hypothetical protein